MPRSRKREVTEMVNRIIDLSCRGLLKCNYTTRYIQGTWTFVRPRSRTRPGAVGQQRMARDREAKFW